jgi:leucyl-tRNA synthetase
LLLLLAPTAPHLTEELWTKTGHTYSIHNQPWPKWDEELTKEEEVTLVIQVNGKLRDRVTVPVSITEAEAKELALSRERIQAYVKDNKVAKIIYVPQRLVNIVVG